MAAVVPPELTDFDKAIISRGLDDIGVESESFLHLGLYTGILAVTLWNISTMKAQRIGRAMVVIILLLHIATIIDLAINWSESHSVFVDHGENLRTKYVANLSPNTVWSIGAGTVGAICSILADSTMIWRCWLVWGRRWLAILLPVIFLLSAIGFKIIGTYKIYTSLSASIFGLVFYTSFLLASTLSCTLLIIYRIVTVARAGGGLRNYHHVLEVFVESSALYSISLILCITFLAREDISLASFETLAVAARVNSYYFPVSSHLIDIIQGVAPTILVGRVAAGHARPDSSWQGSVISGSLRFKVQSRSRCSQSDSMTGHDLEAAEEEVDAEYGHFTAVADSQKAGACEDGSEVQRLGEVSVDSGSYDICQDSSDIQQERDVE
ncbi:hypothetical protein F5146DRAFT_1135364 [Armillaria mellea]|nr:hypothetical protein F5146DRAFT_1135364 [Armillaria mellea]